MKVILALGEGGGNHGVRTRCEASEGPPVQKDTKGGKLDRTFSDLITSMEMAKEETPKPLWNLSAIAKEGELGELF